MDSCRKIESCDCSCHSSARYRQLTACATSFVSAPVSTNWLNYISSTEFLQSLLLNLPICYVVLYICHENVYVFS